MANKIDFSKIISLLEANEDFSLTEGQYLKNTGKELPKHTYYLKNASALSKLVKNYGFQIEINERTVNFKKQI